MGNIIKIAKTDFPILDLLKNRWSPRSFADKSIDKNIIMSLLEAARWSPSAFNEQPWRYVLGVKNEDSNFLKILESLVESNRIWAQNAPVLLACCSRRTFVLNNKVNPYSAYDAGQSIAHLTIQAISENIYVHQMAGFDKDVLRKNCNISEDYEILSVVAIGYVGSPDKLPENLKKIEMSERQRKKISEMLF